MNKKHSRIDFSWNGIEGRFSENINHKPVVLNTDEVYKLIEQKDKEIERLNNIIDEVANDILKELNENKHLSYGVALSIRQKLLNYQELKEGK